jgi:glycosyltransferase involved in cell wall biosynthesis
LVRVFEEAAQGLRIELELIDRTLNENEYQQILKRIDVLVLPYDIDRYARKGSGIVQEALAHAIPFVCSAQTGLVDFLTEENGESARTDEEFASSLLKIVLNYDCYLDRAIVAAAKRYRVLEANPLRDNICGSKIGYGGGSSERADSLEVAAASCSTGWASIASYVSRTAAARWRGPTAPA